MYFSPREYNLGKCLLNCDGKVKTGRALLFFFKRKVSKRKPKRVILSGA